MSDNLDEPMKSIVERSSEIVGGLVYFAILGAALLWLFMPPDIPVKRLPKLPPIASIW
jgi:hypothetical protein